MKNWDNDLNAITEEKSHAFALRMIADIFEIDYSKKSEASLKTIFQKIARITRPMLDVSSPNPLYETILIHASHANEALKHEPEWTQIIQAKKIYNPEDTKASQDDKTSILGLAKNFIAQAKGEQAEHQTEIDKLVQDFITDARAQHAQTTQQQTIDDTPRETTTKENTQIVNVPRAKEAIEIGKKSGKKPRKSALDRKL